MEDGGAGFESISGEVYGSHSAAHFAALLENEDFYGGARGVLLEEVGEGGAGDARANNADLASVADVA